MSQNAMNYDPAGGFRAYEQFGLVPLKDREGVPDSGLSTQDYL